MQAFGAESTAVIAGLPSLQDSADFFQTQSAGPANANLEAMEQDNAGSSSQADDVAQAMDETDAAPASTASAGKAAGGFHPTPVVHCFSLCCEIDAAATVLHDQLCGDIILIQ